MRLAALTGLMMFVGLNCFSQSFKVYHDKQAVELDKPPLGIPMTVDSSSVSWSFKTATDTLIFVVDNVVSFKSAPGTDSGASWVKRPAAKPNQTVLIVYLKAKGDTAANGKARAILQFNWGAGPGPGATNPQTTGTGGNGGDGTQNLSFLYDQYYRNHVVDTIMRTDIGMKSKNDNYSINIFFDQFGNSLYGSVPSGVSSKYHYIIHIIHPQFITGADDFIYSVNKTGGTLSDAPMYYNGNASLKATDTALHKQAGAIAIQMQDSKTELFPTSTDLSFDLILTTISSGTATPKKLGSYTINMTPYYFGAFDIGLIFSNLGNPTYTLVNSPTTSGQQTVKVTNDGTNTFVSILYTVYWSPINQFFPTSSKNDKVTFRSFGRSYLDDNASLLRKIYPCVGISLNDQLLTNWFAGLNCEPAQGIGVFAGWNIRKVNTFNLPNFVPGQTVVTQDQFNYYTNSTLKFQFSWGVEVDISAFLKILGNLSNTH